MKKSKVVLYNILLFIILFPIFDIIASNFFLKIDDAACHKIERYYYELKKNCVGNYKFKPSFPSVKVYTDEYGLRTGKKKINKGTDNNVLIFGDSMTFGVGIKYENTVVGILNKKHQAVAESGELTETHDVLTKLSRSFLISDL